MCILLCSIIYSSGEHADLYIHCIDCALLCVICILIVLAPGERLARKVCANADNEHAEETSIGVEALGDCLHVCYPLCLGVGLLLFLSRYTAASIAISTAMAGGAGSPNAAKSLASEATASSFLAGPEREPDCCSTCHTA